KLVGQRGLADARLAGDKNDSPCTVDHLLQETFELLHLQLATDKRRRRSIDQIRIVNNRNTRPGAGYRGSETAQRISHFATRVVASCLIFRRRTLDNE